MLSRSRTPEAFGLVTPRLKTGAGPVKGPIRLTAARRIGVYAVLALAWLSGAAWLGLHYFVRPAGPFGPTASPLEPLVLKLHGAAAFAALWVFGLLWAAHIVNGWTAGRRRWSGAAVFAAMMVLILTGWLLYYGGDETVRGAASLVHWGLGLGGAALFAWHRWLSRDRR